MDLLTNLSKTIYLDGVCLAALNDTQLVNDLDWTNTVTESSHAELLTLFIEATRQECLQLLGKMLLSKWLENSERITLLGKTALVCADA